MDNLEYLKNIGKNIQKARLKKGLTQEKLAELCNVTDRHIGIIERGLSTGSIPLIINICNALDVSPNYIFNNTFNNSTDNINVLPNEVSISYLKLNDKTKSLVNNIINELYSIQKNK